MNFSLDDTIVAIASPPGAGSRGIIRLSGENLVEIVRRVFPRVGPELERAPSGNRVHDVCLELLPGEPVSGRLLLWPTHQSYTRQPSAELHLLGAPVLLNLAVEAFCQAGARLANRGEFTLRAFLAGRIDLTQAEAVLGIIDAESDRDFQTALRQSSGGLAEPFQKLREQLIDLLAELEATLDFIDQDIEFISRGDLTDKLEQAESAAVALQGQIRGRRELVTTPTIVLVGEPNAGKSSLFNRLAGSELAIVSPQAGTTRDSLRCRLNLGGVEVELIDTAGLEEVAGAMSAAGDQPTPELSVENIAAAAQAQTEQRTASADIVLWCVPATELAGGSAGRKMPPSRRSASQLLLVATKCDELPGVSLPPSWVLTSAETKAGVDLLLTHLARAVQATNSLEAEVMPVTALRCHEQIRMIVDALGQCRQLACQPGGEELIAAELRVALDNLGQIAGTVYNDEILGRIFSRFCIGK